MHDSLDSTRIHEQLYDSTLRFKSVRMSPYSVMSVPAAANKLQVLLLCPSKLPLWFFWGGNIKQQRHASQEFIEMIACCMLILILIDSAISAHPSDCVWQNYFVHIHKRRCNETRAEMCLDDLESSSLPLAIVSIDEQQRPNFFDQSIS